MAGANTQFTAATHALVYLAGVGGAAGDGSARPISSDELARSVNVNPVHLRRVLGPLRRAGLVGSRPGAHGGWELTQPASDIHLDEVWQAVNAGTLVATHLPSPSCAVGRHVQHVIKRLENEITDSVREALHRRTVADLAADATAGATE